MKKALALLAVIVIAVAGIVWGAHQITWAQFITPVRRGFYAAIGAAIAFYSAGFLRALTKYYLAKARRIEQSTYNQTGEL